MLRDAADDFLDLSEDKKKFLIPDRRRKKRSSKSTKQTKK
jgi:hypothetical protein